MNHQGFDDLARKLGNGTPRRSLIKGVIAGIGASIVGRTAMSAHAQASCTVTEDCEGDLICVEGQCQEEQLCSGPNEGCEITEDCCDGTCISGVCIVCHFFGESCEETADCCGGLECLEGVCSVICLAEGEECTDTQQCCTNLFCNAGLCDGSCVGEGVVCEVDDDCCTDLFCDSDGTGLCTQVPACRTIGADCGDDAPCCDGLTCSNNICAEACAAENDNCSTSEDCCDGLQCWGDGGGLGTCFPPDYCKDLGEGCHEAFAPCCDGMSCADGYCIATEPEPEPTPEPTQPVTSLPNTGAGNNGDSSGVIGAAAALGGAAALLTARKLLESKDAEV